MEDGATNEEDLKADLTKNKGFYYAMIDLSPPLSSCTSSMSPPQTPTSPTIPKSPLAQYTPTSPSISRRLSTSGTEVRSPGTRPERRRRQSGSTGGFFDGFQHGGRGEATIRGVSSGFPCLPPFVTMQGAKREREEEQK